jgi:hypothetical protein
MAGKAAKAKQSDSAEKARTGDSPEAGTVEPTPDAPSPPSPDLIPPEVRDAALRLKDSQLQGQTIERVYAADDPNVLPFLEAVAQGNEQRALTTLRGLLAANPRLLEHPYVLAQFQRLFTVWHPLDDDLTDRAKVELVKLVSAWARGMTVGWKVSITKPVTGRRGQTAQYFPHLDDRDGWLPTEQASRERRDAEAFVSDHEELKARLREGVAWKALRSRYSESRPAPVYEVAETIGAIFETFTQERGIERPVLEQKKLAQIARAGLTEPKGRNPSDRVARELIAALPWYTAQDATLKLTPSGIKSTLETLRKKGIGKPTSSR